MMKTIIINGTYRKNGMTSFLVERFIEGIKHNKNAEVKTIDLMQADIRFCEGCSSCMNEKSDARIAKCRIKDDMQRILPEILDSDIAVFATPVFAYGPTAIMKKFIERSVPILKSEGFLAGRNKPDKKKTGVIILSTGAPFPINMLIGITWYSEFILKFMSSRFARGKTHMLRAGAMEASVAMKKKWGDKAYGLGKKISLKYKV